MARPKLPLSSAGLVAIAWLPMAGKIGGVVLIGVALLIFRLRRQAAAARGKYPPAEPGALVCEPLKAANRGR